jgi:hypothetical protein
MMSSASRRRSLFHGCKPKLAETRLVNFTLKQWKVPRRLQSKEEDSGEAVISVTGDVVKRNALDFSRGDIIGGSPSFDSVFPPWSPA